MGCGDVRLLRTIGGLDVTGQERAALNKLTMPGGGVLQDVELIEHDLRCRQLVRHGVDVGPMHVRTDRLDRGALPGIEARRQQPRQAGLRPVFGQAERMCCNFPKAARARLVELAGLRLMPPPRTSC